MCFTKDTILFISFDKFHLTLSIASKSVRLIYFLRTKLESKVAKSAAALSDRLERY